MAGGSEVVIRRSQSIEQANERYRSRPKLPIIYHTEIAETYPSSMVDREVGNDRKLSVSP